MNFILKGDVCFSSDSRHIATFENAFAVCEGKTCAGVFREIPEKYRSYPVHDFSGCLIVPGMTDLHIHAPQYAYRGLGMDLELLSWLKKYAFREEEKYRDAAYAKKAYAIFASAMKNSATTRAVVFSSIHTDTTEILMEYLEKTGVVSYVGKVSMDYNPGETYVETVEEAAREAERFILGVKDRFKNTYPIITPRFAPSCSDGLMKNLGEIAARYEVPVQSHLSENPAEVKLVHSLFPWSRFYGDVYDRCGLFGKNGKCVMAHCVYSSDEELDLMKENGVFAAHCPASNMNVSSGIAPVRKLLEKGISVGLGSDVAGGQSESIFQAAVAAVQNSKLYWRVMDESVSPLTFDEAFFMATKGGGRFFGDVGSFEKGDEFDAVVLADAFLPHPQPLSVRQRLERAFYLGADLRCLKAKYCRGEKIF